MQNIEPITRNPNEIEEEIVREETFKQIDSDKLKETAVFVEEAPHAALQKLLTLPSCQNTLEIMGYCKNLTDLAYSIGPSIIPHLTTFLIPLLKLPNDGVKRVLLAQIIPLAGFLKSKDAKVNYPTRIREILLPLISHVLKNECFDLKEIAVDLTIHITKELSGEDRGNYVLPIVLEMAHDEVVDDNRVVAIRLLNKLAAEFGADLCEHFVGFEILSLGEDPQVRVRKESVNGFNEICRVVSEKFKCARLLPFFVRLIEDKAWTVRKACVEELVSISSVVSSEFRHIQLIPIMQKMLKDTSKQVKISAYKNLGHFISTLTSDYDTLLAEFSQMPNSVIPNLGCEAELLYSCAFYFPGVLLTVGPSKWEVLSKAYLTMAKCIDRKVRRSLSCSLHEIAKIIPDIAEDTLVPILKEFLTDECEEVVYGALEHMADFLLAFNPVKREPLLGLLVSVQKNQNKFKVRELIAQQINKLIQVFTPEETFNHVVPICFELCNDSVTLVRQEAAKHLPYVLLQMLRNEKEGTKNHINTDTISYTTQVKENIRQFALNKSYHSRQTFVQICEGLMSRLPDPSFFEANFLGLLEPLAQDKVVNVRISLAILLFRHIRDKGAFTDHPSITKIVEILEKDHSKEIIKLIERTTTMRNLFKLQGKGVQPAKANIEMSPLEEKKGSFDVVEGVLQSPTGQVFGVKNNGKMVDEKDEQKLLDQKIKENGAMKPENVPTGNSTRIEIENGGISPQQ